MASVAEIIARIDDKIYAILADPDDIADYQIGDVRVAKSQILTKLEALREKYQKLAEEEPFEDVRHIALDFGEFGEDESELIGDEDV